MNPSSQGTQAEIEWGRDSNPTLELEESPIFVAVGAGGTVRAVDIPDWAVWIVLGLAILQALSLVPIVRRLRGPNSVVRSEARLELLDVVASLLLMSGLMLNLTESESWFWLAVTGFVLMTAVYAVKGIRWLRARRSLAS